MGRMGVLPGEECKKRNPSILAPGMHPRHDSIRMIFGTALGTLAALCLIGAFRVPMASPLLGWAAASLAVVSAGYFGVGPRVVGKRADGSLPAWRRWLLLPYLLYTWAFWKLYCRTQREPVFHLVAPGLVLGRRPQPEELPPDVRVVVDMTAEFPAAPTIVARGHYRSLPALDGGVPDEAPFEATVAALVAERGSVYVHCAFGHGRSAALVAALMVGRGLAADAADAEARMKAIRPRVRMMPAQRRLVDRVCAKLGLRPSPVDDAGPRVTPERAA